MPSAPEHMWKGVGQRVRASKQERAHVAAAMGMRARKVCTPHLVPPKKNMCFGSCPFNPSLHGFLFAYILRL